MEFASIEAGKERAQASIVTSRRILVISYVAVYNHFALIPVCRTYVRTVITISDSEGSDDHFNQSDVEQEETERYANSTDVFWNCSIFMIFLISLIGIILMLT